MLPDVHLSWHGPLSFFRGSDVLYVFEDSVAKRDRGPYLWTIEPNGGYL